MHIVPLNSCKVSVGCDTYSYITNSSFNLGCHTHCSYKLKVCSITYLSRLHSTPVTYTVRAIKSSLLVTGHTGNHGGMADTELISEGLHRSVIEFTDQSTDAFTTIDR